MCIRDRNYYVMGDGVSPELTQARLWLAEAARIGLANGLGLLGVSAPESMWLEDTEEEDTEEEAAPDV